MGRTTLWTLRHDTPAVSDEQLTERARSGDRAAFGELYRRHRKAAESTARCLLRSRSDVDDVVSDAFAGVLSALDNGRGPRDNFRCYLLACVRNGCRVRRPVVAGLADEDRAPDGRAAPTFEDPERYVEADTVARAFAALTPRWQNTLWLTEVEQWSATEVSEELQLSPNAAAVLTKRARDAFATAYLAEHVSSAPSDVCARHSAKLAAYVRDQLGDAQRSEIEHHLVLCEHCTKAVSELRDVNGSLRSLVPAPGTVVGAGIGTQVSLAGTSIGGATTGLLSGGLILKAAAVLLVVSPVFLYEATKDGRSGDPDAAIVEAGEAGDRDGDGARGAQEEPHNVVAPTVTAAPARPTTTAVAVAPTTDAGERPAGGGGREAVPTTGGVDDGGGGGGDVVNVLPTLPTLPSVTIPITRPEVLPQLLAPVSSLLTPIVHAAIPVVDEITERTVVLLDDVLATTGLFGHGDVVELVDFLIPTPGSGLLLPVLDAVLAGTPLEIDIATDSVVGALLDAAISVFDRPSMATTTAPVTSAAPASPSAPTTGHPSAGTTPGTPGIPSTPGATAPPATVPVPTAAPGTTPQASSTAPSPAITLPPITLPTLTLPPLTLPPLTLPPIDLSLDLSGLGLGVISIPPITIPNLLG